MATESTWQPGLIVLFGSGEISSSGRRVYDWLFARMAAPIRVAVLETPAGFQPNSAHVAEEIAQFLRVRLQNYHPEVTVVPARKRGTPYSPNAPEIVAPLLRANVVFLGPGSPTYAVRQLRDSLAWYTLMARHRLGAAIVLSSAATIAVGAYALPVYEIYKVGTELHWVPGLDFLGAFGLSLVLVPHWDNREGGATLDTSRCFMGQERFERLRTLLPRGVTVLGIEEHTAMILDLGAGHCRVMGRGSVTCIRGDTTMIFTAAEAVPLGVLGDFRMPSLRAGIPEHVWQNVERATQQLPEMPTPPEEVLRLVEAREAARARRDWQEADALRARIAALGWHIQDTREGPRLQPLIDAPMGGDI
ncbi:MAG: cysteinyl-tRNA synthetase [Anaerolineae bacterium]|nr:cysteinyl-tRNA synthetase [Anaerolineae bacterium]MDW8072275.1 cysteinyl-tRNA synthetase [Anaerolineae bacterium]